MPKVTLLLVFHNHQPVGNLHRVFESATNDCYLPLVQTLREFPNLKFSLHFTGPLWNWLEKHNPEVINITKEMVDRHQVEILGGGYYEPMLAILPDHDAIGQLTYMKQRIQDVFHHNPEGMWLAERVWEPDLARVISKSGYKYTLLDDRHFHSSGLTGDLDGYYVTEKAGEQLAIFPISQTLRYAIPFADPEKAVEEILRVASLKNSDNVVLTYGDDGEKFGVWPGTFDLVWNRKWLKRFFSLLDNMKDEIELSTPSEVMKQFSPNGRIYLPTASYEEMGEWTLTPNAQASYKNLKKLIKIDEKILTAVRKHKNYIQYLFPIIESMKKLPIEWIQLYGKLMKNGGNTILHTSTEISSFFSKKSRLAKQFSYITNFVDKLSPALEGNNIFINLVDELSDITTELFSIYKNGINIKETDAFIHGGIWQGFIAKYHETNLIHKKMINVSQRLQKLKDNPVGTDAKLLEKAQDNLYQAQCNCAYWHGIFGGLYMVHLRHALYEHLILSEKYMDRYESKKASLEVFDYDSDFRDEIFFSSPEYSALIKPDLGGGLLEFDIKQRNFNILNVMTRQKEGYHSGLLVKNDNNNEDSQTASIHDINNYVDSETFDKLIYDFGPRFAFQDYFISENSDYKDLFSDFYKRRISPKGNFTFGKYEITNVNRKTKQISLVKTDFLDETEIKFIKTYKFTKNHIELTYVIESLNGEFTGQFISESSFTLLSGTTPDRRIFINHENIEGDAGLGGTKHNVKADSFGMISFYDGLKYELLWSPNAQLFVYPIESVSKNEKGVETNYQGTAAAIVFEINLKQNNPIQFKFKLNFELFPPQQ